MRALAGLIAAALVLVAGCAPHAVWREDQDYTGGGTVVGADGTLWITVVRHRETEDDQLEIGRCVPSPGGELACTWTVLRR
jgi:hypothetical protein